MKRTKRLHIEVDANEGKVCAVYSVALGDGGATIATLAGCLKGSYSFRNHRNKFEVYSSEKALLEKFAVMYKKHKRADEVQSSTVANTRVCMEKMLKKGMLSKEEIVPVHFNYRTM